MECFKVEKGICSLTAVSRVKGAELSLDPGKWKVEGKDPSGVGCGSQGRKWRRLAETAPFCYERKKKNGLEAGEVTRGQWGCVCSCFVGYQLLGNMVCS